MEPERRRRRPAVSCILCRRRKIKCNREVPCSNCTKSKNAECIYRDAPRAPAQTRRQGRSVESRETSQTSLASAPDAPSALSPLSPSISTPSTATPNHQYHDPSRPTTTATNRTADLVARTGSHARPARSQTVPEQGHQAVSSSGPSSTNTPVSTFTKNSRVETRTVNVSGNFYFHSEHRLASAPQAVTRCVTHKTRLFGQSHWVNALALLNDMFDVIERHLRDDTSTVFKVEKRCKSIARIIKSRRAPPWPCAPTPELPARAVADALIERYLGTSETVFRVLHIPSFRRDYESVWDPGSNPDPAFLVQLKLVLAIGSSTYDSDFSLRSFATQWVYEAQTWLSAPEFKSQLGIPSLQTNILSLIAREATGIGEDMVWANLGATLRIAMYMGLHRDPAGLGPRITTPLVDEMRRRLWNTILELALQSSLTSGGPPLVSLDEFDTEPPGNFDDDQLPGQDGEDPVPKPNGQFTQMTMAIALRSMLPQRLAIARYLNDLSSHGTYGETLKLDTELRKAYKNMTQTLQASRSQLRCPSNLELRAVDLIIRRYFLALHLPFFAPALEESAFAFSRRVIVESALRIWRAAFPLPLSASTTSDDLLTRIAINGSGFFHTVAVQAFVVIAVELKTLIQEEGILGLGPVELRPDLMAALQDFKLWCWKSMETGTTNTKGYLIACMVCAQMEALQRGMGEEEAIACEVKAAEEAEDKCLVLLQGIEAKSRQPQGAVEIDGAGGGLDLTPEYGAEDWDYMASNLMFDSVGVDPMSWMFQGLG
ncbi:Acetamidase regulatory protein [Chaetomidium leptoderma]|uniref:Acetamidase regulatory protein n=1 Tax=Chaetomidium leptoderma TaxID=669021 RepID=A0AAN6VFN0_9PEZI|nr:Acetamidase regulatory protein [Chaetomidium leptoderma]